MSLIVDVSKNTDKKIGIKNQQNGQIDVNSTHKWCTTEFY